MNVKEAYSYSKQVDNKIAYFTGKVLNINDHRESPHLVDELRIDTVSYRDKKRNLRPTSKEKVPQLSGLALEVDRIKKRGDQELYLLPGTGFQVRTQVDLLLENYKNGVPLSNSLQQIEQDIQGFKTEYLLELPVFPIVLEKKEYEGRERIVGKLYGGKPLSEATSGDEREGIVKESAILIEEKLLDAKPGTMVIMTSPSGWSGYQSKDNKLEKLNPLDVINGAAEEVIYPDSQTYCYRVQDDGSIRGFTLKTNMTLSQNKKLLQSLGTPKGAFSEKVDNVTDIKRVVGNVVIIDPEKNKNIEDIVQMIKQIKGSEFAYIDSAKRSRTFSEMMGLLKNPESLWRLDDTVKKNLNPLSTYISSRITEFDSEIRSDLETGLGLTVLKLMHEIRPPKQRYMEVRVVYDTDRPVYIPFNAHDALEEMKKIGGCAGGGNKNKDIIQSLTPRVGLKNPLDEKQEWFSCPKCGYKADGPIGNTCPGCNLTKEEYAAEEGAVLCD